jgi:SAM-dependent methyltransferase
LGFTASEFSNGGIEMNQTLHLDLGCGPVPRNPYAQQVVYGVDLRAGLASEHAVMIKAANLCSQPIPFEDSFFDSVSAYDFLEHIPRVTIGADGSTRFPFIELMDEIWRVLKPGGMLYAQTPAYPSSKAFQDPTHVNIITDRTQMYFTEPKLLARMYGFHGTFKKVRQVRIDPQLVYEPESFLRVIRRGFRRIFRRNSHLIWEFQALK